MTLDGSLVCLLILRTSTKLNATGVEKQCSAECIGSRSTYEIYLKMLLVVKSISRRSQQVLTGYFRRKEQKEEQKNGRRK